MLRRKLFESASSEEIIMLTFDDVKGRPLISHKLHELTTVEILFRTSVSQCKLKVYALKPCFKLFPVPFDLYQKTIRFYELRWRRIKTLGWLLNWSDWWLWFILRSYHFLDVYILSLLDPLEPGLFSLNILRLLLNSSNCLWWKIDMSYHLIDINVLSLPDPLELGLFSLFLFKVVEIIGKMREIHYTHCKLNEFWWTNRSVFTN